MNRQPSDHRFAAGLAAWTLSGTGRNLGLAAAANPGRSYAGTSAAPAISGSLEQIHGTVDLLGKTFTFTASPDFDLGVPGLNLAMKSTIQGTIELNFVLIVGIDGARFRRPVEPGDQLALKATLERTMRGIWKFATVAEVGGSEVASATMMVALGRRP